VADFEEDNGRNHPVTSNAVIPDNSWTHVAVSYEPESALWKMYINGKLNTTKDLGSNITPGDASAATTAIATSMNSRRIAQGFFKGSIDEVRVWNVARTDEEILDNYKEQLTQDQDL
jgi:hypothetical protein